MLRAAFAFLLLALLAGALGFTNVMGQSLYIARVLFFVFLVVFLAGLIYSLVKQRRVG